MKPNCWEVKGCGREPGGANCDALGVCPAAVEMGVDGVNGGKNGGRACWALAGTYSVDGPECQKVVWSRCSRCDFYRLVVKEELPELTQTHEILAKVGYAPVTTLPPEACS